MRSEDFKKFIASEMALIDSIHLTEKTYEQHYELLIQWRDFDLLAYWLTYNGVFDGGESMLEHLKILIDGSPTVNINSVINNCNI